VPIFRAKMERLRKTLKVAGATLLFFAILEQIRFYVWRKNGNNKRLPGPTFAPPFIGKIFSIIADPEKFWDDQRNFGELSWNSLVGKFMVFATSLPVVRAAFQQNGPDSFLLTLHPNGEIILGADNIAFQHGPSHKALRASFLSLFTRKALSTYIVTQYGLIQKHLDTWVKMCEQSKDHVEMWPHVRLLNTLTSQTVFLGDNLSEHELFTDLFLVMTQGFLSLPLCVPGTGLWDAARAKDKIVIMLEAAVGKSKKWVSAGNEPRCLLDFWSQHMLKLIAVNDGPTPPEHSSDREMGMVMMDFLFAAQDASTSSLTWTLALMADHPEILARVREEQQAVRPNHEPITYELMDKMTFTRAVVMEILRFRPPAPMLVFTAQKDMKLTEDYTIPKSGVLIADIWKPTIEGFPNGTTFDPDRWLAPRREDVQYRDSFLTFGLGPHLCVGQNYAINHLATFLAEVAMTCEWTRQITPQSSKLNYLPTINPGDCLVHLSKRTLAM